MNANCNYRGLTQVLGLALLGAVFSHGASAATCTSSGVIPPKTITASLDGAISSTVGSAAGDGCTAMADGNLDNMGPITVFGEDWDLIQKDAKAINGSTGPLLIVDTSGDSSDSKSGTWSIDLTNAGIGNYNTFVVGLKPANGFVYYNVGTTTSGTYGTITLTDADLSHGLSHANLYGWYDESIDLDPVPIPAAAWLFGSALMGLVGVARRRKV